MKTVSFNQLHSTGGYLAAAVDFTRPKSTYSLMQARTAFETSAEEAERILNLLLRLPTADVHAKARLKSRLHQLISTLFRSKKMLPSAATTPLLLGIMDRLTAPTPLVSTEETRRCRGTLDELRH
jgi:hypothetical protein